MLIKTSIAWGVVAADEEDARGRLLPADAGSIEGAISIAEQHYAKR
jgi:hypothetical protein